jgi:hypothetical protein
MAMTGRVSMCRWCSTPLVLDNDGQWIHTSLSYTCRTVWSTVMAPRAEPATDASARPEVPAWPT